MPPSPFAPPASTPENSAVDAPVPSRHQRAGQPLPLCRKSSRPRCGASASRAAVHCTVVSADGGPPASTAPAASIISRISTPGRPMAASSRATSHRCNGTPNITAIEQHPNCRDGTPQRGVDRVVHRQGAEMTNAAQIRRLSMGAQIGNDKSQSPSAQAWHPTEKPYSSLSRDSSGVYLAQYHGGEAGTVRHSDRDSHLGATTRQPV